MRAVQEWKDCLRERERKQLINEMQNQGLKQESARILFDFLKQPRDIIKENRLAKLSQG